MKDRSERSRGLIIKNVFFDTSFALLAGFAVFIFTLLALDAFKFAEFSNYDGNGLFNFVNLIDSISTDIAILTDLFAVRTFTGMALHACKSTG